MKIKFFLLVLFCHFIANSQLQIGSNIVGENAGDQFGNALAISGDGTTVAVGAYLNDGNGNHSGHVRVYQNNGGIWNKIGSDIDGEAAEDNSGIAVAMSSNGQIVAIGAFFNDGGGSNSGHVRVYENIAGVWTQLGSDIDGEASGDNSGLYLSLSDDGKIVAIGAISNDAGNPTNTENGHVRIFEFKNNAWTQLGADIDGEEGDRFGQALALSGDGTTFAASTPDGGSQSSGSTLYAAVKVFEFVGGIWTQIGNNIESEQQNDRSRSVALSTDGKIMAIGSPLFSSSTKALAGRVQVFENVGGVWTQKGADIIGDNVADEAGTVDISADGSIVAIGSILNNDGAIRAGQVRIFQFISGDWVQVGTDIYGTENDQAGRLSLSSDGSKVAIGGPDNSANGSNSGVVRVFDLSSTLSVDQFVQNSFSLTPNPSNERLTINVSSAIELRAISIYNVYGQKTMVSFDPVIDVSQLDAGVYLVEIITDSGRGAKKLIKK